MANQTTDDLQLSVLIPKCCGTATDRPLDEFREAWFEFLRSDLTQFTPNAVEIRSVADAAWPEYRKKFNADYNEAFDYTLYFRAVAYAHLSRLRQDRGMQKLLATIPARGLFRSVNYDCHILVYVALLRLKDCCAGYLLDLSFDLTSRELDPKSCLDNLKDNFVQKGWFTVALNHLF
jgi:hypothetical protein